MKANHNALMTCKSIVAAVFNISKIQDESKSQLITDVDSSETCCFQYFKDTR